MVFVWFTAVLTIADRDSVHGPSRDLYGALWQLTCGWEGRPHQGACLSQAIVHPGLWDFLLFEFVSLNYSSPDSLKRDISWALIYCPWDEVSTCITTPYLYTQLTKYSTMQLKRALLRFMSSSPAGTTALPSGVMHLYLCLSRPLQGSSAGQE